MLKMSSRKFSSVGIKSDTGPWNEDKEGMSMQTPHTESRGKVEKMRGGKGEPEVKVCPGDSLVGPAEPPFVETLPFLCAAKGSEHWVLYL